MQSFQVGVVTKPHGIKGELRVFPTTENPERFKLLVGHEVTVGNDSREIVGAKVTKGMAVVRFRGIDDRNSAEGLLGQKIYISDALALPLSEDMYYERDIIGMGVYDEFGNRLGEIEKILSSPANDVYVVKPEKGKAYMFPAVKEIVLDVSPEDRKMTVRMPLGMEELTV